MMSYGSTAETSFSLVRTLVAHDPALLARMDSVLEARGFAKLVRGDTFVSQHPRARAEAVRELKWLRKYLENVHDRADRFAPQEPGGRATVIDDDDDDEPQLNGDAAKSERDGRDARAGYRSATDSHAPSALARASPSSPETAPPQLPQPVVPESAPKEYDHTSEESDGSLEEPEPAAAPPTDRSAEEPDGPDKLEGDHPAEVKQPVNRVPDAPAAQGSDPLSTRAAPGTGAARRAVEQQEAQSRLLRRQQHAAERERARRLHKQQRAAREQKRAASKQQHEREHERADGAELWCLCRKPAYGFMLACVNPKCPYEWYHGGCVGVDAAPKARWFCPLCRPKYGREPTRARAAKRLQGAAKRSHDAAVAAAIARPPAHAATTPALVKKSRVLRGSVLARPT